MSHSTITPTAAPKNGNGHSAGNGHVRTRPLVVGRSSVKGSPRTRRAGPNADVALSVRGLEKHYGERTVLVGVDFEIRRGEVYCLLGPNGAGKTTTVEILEGYRPASKGTVRVLGYDPAGQATAFRQRIGVVLQECGFPSHARVEELLNAYRHYYPSPRALEELLEVVDLRGERRSLVRSLSGGQRRRLDLALALAGDPDLVFLDEPTTGFDPAARRRCWAAIGNLRSLGKTVLLTTHYLDEAESLADRVGILTKGRITAEGAPAALARLSGAPTMVSFSIPPTARRRSVNLPGGMTGTVRSGRVVIPSQDPEATVRRLMHWSRRDGFGGLPELAIVPPSLEEVYLTLIADQPQEDS